MDLPATFFALRWLTRDTFRQAWASGLLAAATIATAIATMFCLSVSIRGDTPIRPLDPWEIPAILPKSEAAKLSPKDVLPGEVEVPSGEMSVLFGAIRVPLKRSRVEAVRTVEVLLAAGVADTAGVLLALLWTAGFLPAFLDPAAISVMLAKPVPRWTLFAGKVGGIVGVVTLVGLAFLGATGIALGAKTNVWDAYYFAALPLLLVHFLAFFSLSALLAVLWRSPVVAALGSVLGWLGCWAVNYAATASSGGQSRVLYWLLPKPADLSAILFRALQTTAGPATERFAAEPELSILTSLLLPVVGLAIAARIFHRADY